MDISLGPKIEADLRASADELPLPVQDVAVQAIAEILEDREDYKAGIEALGNHKYAISQEEMMRRSELAGLN